MPSQDARALQTAALAGPTDLEPDAVRDVAGALSVLLADMIALYLKTKNFHWHVSGPHFRDYHPLLDEQSDQIFGTTDDIAERVRKIGGTTLRSIGHVSRLQRVIDSDADDVTPMDMLAELRDDNKQLTARMRETHDLCDEYGGVATASLLEIGSMKPSGGRGSCSSRSVKNYGNDMAQATTQFSVTSQTIAVEHIRVLSERPFAEVRRKLEGTVPRLDTGIAEALRSGDQKRAEDYEENGPKLSIFGARDHGALLQR
jgi:starvation-inducible DNA-binding protein